MRNNFPDNWIQSNLGEDKYVKTIMGQSPPSSSYNVVGNGTPFIQGSAEFGFQFAKPKQFTTQPKKIAEKDDVLISVRAPVGDVNYAPNRLCLGRGVAALRPNPSLVDHRFLFYYLRKEKNQFHSLSTGSTFKAISKRDLPDFSLLVPPLVEQQGIAEVLGTVDEAIRVQVQVIAKTELLKQGLMRQLLTEGIGHTEYKETQLGRIPKTWAIKKLKEVTIKIRDMDHKMPQKVNDGIPFISVTYLLKNREPFFIIKYEDKNVEFISQDEHNKHKDRFNVEKGDILYSRFGTIGHARLINTDEPFLASYSIVMIKVMQKIVSSLFFVYCLNGWNSYKQATMMTKGSTNKNLHLEDIRDMIIALPPMNEQNTISQILVNVDDQININHNKRFSLLQIKEGLMQVLLSGERRVELRKNGLHRV